MVQVLEDRQSDVSLGHLSDSTIPGLAQDIRLSLSDRSSVRTLTRLYKGSGTTLTSWLGEQKCQAGAAHGSAWLGAQPLAGLSSLAEEEQRM
jgi:hypothetical protein